MARSGKPDPGDLRLLLPGRKANELALNFAGNIIKHLGVQMYAGRPVPAIAELVSNAWDADAKEVNIRLPLDQPWDPNDQNQVIEVVDNGHGMTWDTIKDAYLDIGRDRREAENTDTSPGGRPLQGRKGVGKLAGFGIADVLEIQTVHEDPDPAIGERALIWFRLTLPELKKIKGQAPVDLIYAGPTAKAPPGGRKTHGTTVILRHLHQRNAQNEERFHHSMAERFLFLGAQFRVTINRGDLRHETIKTQWRWPRRTDEWRNDNVAGCGPVQYWIGFTKTPRQQNLGQLSGILIYTRRKISQEATTFEISGGATGQHGLRYMVGMVRAEWLDVGSAGPDHIATPRDSIAWESPQGAAFRDWGQQLVRKHLKLWAKLRTRERVKHLKEVSPQISARIRRLAPAYRDVAVKFIDQFKSFEMEAEDFESIFTWFLDALENATLRSILEKLRDSDLSDLKELDDLLSKMEVRTAVALLQIIESNLAAIDTLEKMHAQDAKERGVLSKHLENNPWLFDATWMLNKSEARVAKWIKDQFGLTGRRKKGDDNRVDFFCVGVGGTLHIVEIKRGAHVAKSADLLQAEKYRKYVVKRFGEISDPKAIKYTHVQSHLIAASLHEDAESAKEALAAKAWVFFTTWDDLIERAKHSHTQFQTALQRRALDADDPEIDEEEEPEEPVVSPKTKTGEKSTRRRKK